MNKKCKHWKSIIKTKSKDIEQNEKIPNLIRVWETEFNKQPSIIFDKIENKMNENLEQEV